MRYIYKIDYDYEGFTCTKIVVADDTGPAVLIADLSGPWYSNIEVTQIGTALAGVACDLICTQEP